MQDVFIVNSCALLYVYEFHVSLLLSVNLALKLILLAKVKADQAVTALVSYIESCT